VFHEKASVKKVPEIIELIYRFPIRFTRESQKACFACVAGLPNALWGDTGNEA
jgi:hypothetical protein